MFRNKILTTSLVIILGISLVLIPSLIMQKATAKFAIAIGGDYNCKPKEGALTIKGIDQTNLLWMGLGDYGYDKVQCFIDNAENIAEDNDLITCVIGNHELRIKGDMVKMIKFCKSNPDGSFAVTIKGDNEKVLLVGLNLYVPWKVGTAQYNYIKSVLANSTDKGYTQKIFNVHELLKAFETKGGHDPVKGLLDTYLPLFKKWGVKIVNQAHNHVQAVLLGSIDYTICGTGGEMGDKLIPKKVGNWQGATATEKGFCIEEFDGKSTTLYMVKQDGKERDCGIPTIKQCRFKLT
jgi:hypothetical protein